MLLWGRLLKLFRSNLPPDMSKIYLNLFLLLCVTGLMQCTYLEYETASGDIGGSVILYGQGRSMLDEHSGVTLIMDNGKTQYRTVSDAGGNFIVEGVSAGTYNLRAEKKDYGTFHLSGMVYPGGPARYKLENPIILGRNPQVSIVSLNMEARKFMGMRFFDGQIQVGHNYTGSEHIHFRLFVHTHANVRYDNYTMSTVVNGVGRNIQFSISLEPEMMADVQSFYFALYPCNLCDLSYRDIQSGKEIYYNIDTETYRVASARMP